MAGILGYVGDQEVLQVLLRTIPRISYVGTDSWGICTYNGTIHIRKWLGRPQDRALQGTLNLSGKAGIAHTRFATHGEPSEANAHPITDCSGRIAVVHNGVIHNHQEIRAALERKGHRFATWTDTEAIPHLVEEFCRNGSSLDAAIGRAYQSLAGSFSFALLGAGQGERIYACKRQHPLYIGTSETSSVVTSEPSCLVGIAQKAAALRTGELAILEPGEVKTLEILPGDAGKRTWVPVGRQHLADNRLGFRHYMEKEINFEPDLLLIMAVGDLMGVELIADAAERSDRLYLVSDPACYNSSLVSSYLIEDIARIHSSVLLAREFNGSEERLSKGDLVIAMCSGSPETSLLEALELARKSEARTALLAGNGLSELSSAGSVVRLGPLGPGSLSPMAVFTAQVSVSLAIAHAIRGQIDRARKASVSTTANVQVL